MITTPVYRLGLIVLVAGFFLSMAQPAVAKNVKITPIGSHTGEFCRFDRALVLEDPDGSLGKIDVVLVSHMHGDHVGDSHLKHVNAGECAKPEASEQATPNTNSVNIALARKATIITGSEMPKFFAAKLKALGGDPGAAQLVRFGGSRKVGGVTITTVPAVHSNGIAGAMIDGALGDMLDAAGLTAYAGPPTGYVLTFSNGLVVYLSGDTGITAEQDSVVRRHYGARLVVINIGDTFTTGPKEAAWVINELVKPVAVIASHANEAATEGGKVIAGTRTETFINASRVPVHIPLSGRTMEFDSRGQCVAGC
jgi:L-ascorbate metabolism protein UlaG (beta-lactamase superfamily)